VAGRSSLSGIGGCGLAEYLVELRAGGAGPKHVEAALSMAGLRADGSKSSPSVLATRMTSSPDWSIALRAAMSRSNEVAVS
jgi:hypothetical protein